MSWDFETKGPNDLLNKRTFSLSDGGKLSTKKDEQTGFWTIHRDKGQIPAFLSGQYTDFQIAKTKIESYAALQALEITHVQATPVQTAKREITTDTIFA